MTFSSRGLLFCEWTRFHSLGASGPLDSDCIIRCPSIRRSRMMLHSIRFLWRTMNLTAMRSLFPSEIRCSALQFGRDRKQRSHSGQIHGSPQKPDRIQHHPAPPNRRASNDAVRIKRAGSTKRVKPSPFAKQQAPKKRMSSYQELYQSVNDPPLQQMAPQMNAHEMAQEMHRSPLRGTHGMAHQHMHSPLQQTRPQNPQHGQRQQQMMSPTNSMYPQQHSYHHAVLPSQEYSQNQSYDVNEYYEPQRMHPEAPMQRDQYHEYERQERELANQIHHLTEQEQRVVRSIHHRQQSQLSRAVPPRQRSNSYGRR